MMSLAATQIESNRCLKSSVLFLALLKNFPNVFYVLSLLSLKETILLAATWNAILNTTLYFPCRCF